MAGRLRLTAQADLDVYYEADAQRYAAGSTAVQVVTRPVFKAFYAHCPSVGFELDGQPIGGLLFDGRAAHIAVLPAYHGRWALLLKPALAWLFTLQPEVMVEVDTDNLKCIDFLNRHGWACVARQGDTVHYRLVAQGGMRKTGYPFRPVPPA